MELLVQLEEQIAGLEKQLKQEAESDERVQRLLTHPGVGLLTVSSPKCGTNNRSTVSTRESDC